MPALYVETSSLLKVIFCEEGYESIAGLIENSSTVLTSQLTLIEVHRAISRAQALGAIKPAEAKRLGGLAESHLMGWNILGLIDSIRRRSGLPFPVEPVRALDAIHLATALEFVTVFHDLVVLSNDDRILGNLTPLGLQQAG